MWYLWRWTGGGAIQFRCSECCILKGTDACDECYIYIEWFFYQNEPYGKNLMTLFKGEDL